MQSVSLVLDRGVEMKISDLGAYSSGGGAAVFGILIGQRSQSAIYIVHLARTLKSDQINDGVQESSEVKPASPKRPPSKQLGSSSQSGESIFDEQSFLQHVRQAIRALPGGMDIVGCFLVSSLNDKKHAQNLTAVHKALRSAYKVCTKLTSVCGVDGAGYNGQMVLLSIESLSSNRLISATLVDCRPDVQSGAPSTNIPFSSQTLHWRCLTTRLIFDAPLFVPVKNGRDTFLKQFSESVRPWCKRFWTSTATVNGQLRDGDQLLSVPAPAASGKRKKQQDDKTIDLVDFYFTEDRTEPSKSENGAVTMQVGGSMYCVAYVHQKATVDEGIRALKMDALRSLYSRCELHYDGMAVLEGEELDPVAVHQFPRRVFAPLANTEILVNDYLFEGDVSGDAVASFKDLLDLDVTQDMVEDKVERTPTPDALNNLFRSGSLSSTPDGSLDNLDRPGTLNSNDRRTRHALVYAVLAVLIAILAAIVYMLVGKEGVA